jgi:hypothetical protein
MLPTIIICMQHALNFRTDIYLWLNNLYISLYGKLVGIALESAPQYIYIDGTFEGVSFPIHWSLFNIHVYIKH